LEDRYKLLDVVRRNPLMVQRSDLSPAGQTESGNLGHMNLYVREGDLACLFYGSKVLCVMREISQLRETARCCYKVVGQRF
jgi:hypothetical protein